MRRIRKPFAVGASSLLLLLTLTPAVLAAGTRTARPGVGGAGITAGSARKLPNTNIKGSPAHFSPSKLSGKSRWPGKPTKCTTSVGSFTMSNKKGSSEKVKFPAEHFKVTIRAHKVEVICVKKGLHGTLVGKLSDGKKLTVHISS